MDFRILGPLEVHEDDRLVEVGAWKQRALLAVLLLHAGQAVPDYRLIDALCTNRTFRTLGRRRGPDAWVAVPLGFNVT